jgi:hypothetical protein
MRMTTSDGTPAKEEGKEEGGEGRGKGGSIVSAGMLQKEGSDSAGGLETKVGRPGEEEGRYEERKAGYQVGRWLPRASIYAGCRLISGRCAPQPPWQCEKRPS